MASVDLRGAELSIVTPQGQPCQIVFEFTPLDISTFVWRGQVRADPKSVTADAAFTFTPSSDTAVIAALAVEDIDLLPAGQLLYYEIDTVVPARQMFYGRLTVTQDAAR